MTDLDPAIWDNETLGAAANGVFLDVLEKQQLENRAAAIEGRPARIVKRENRYPGYVSDNPNKPDAEFGASYNDGSSVVPVIAPPEDGYNKFDESPADSSSKGAKLAAKPVDKK